MFLILQFSWLEKERKKQYKSQPSPLAIKSFTFFQPFLLFQPPPLSPLPQLLVFDIFSNPTSYYSTPPVYLRPESIPNEVRHLLSEMRLF